MRQAFLCCPSPEHVFALGSGRSCGLVAFVSGTMTESLSVPEQWYTGHYDTQPGASCRQGLIAGPFREPPGLIVRAPLFWDTVMGENWDLVARQISAGLNARSCNRKIHACTAGVLMCSPGLSLMDAHEVHGDTPRADTRAIYIRGRV